MAKEGSRSHTFKRKRSSIMTPQRRRSRPWKSQEGRSFWSCLRVTQALVSSTPTPLGRQKHVPWLKASLRLGSNYSSCDQRQLSTSPSSGTGISGSKKSQRKQQFLLVAITFLETFGLPSERQKLRLRTSSGSTLQLWITSVSRTRKRQSKLSSRERWDWSGSWLQQTRSPSINQSSQWQFRRRRSQKSSAIPLALAPSNTNDGVPYSLIFKNKKHPLFPSFHEYVCLCRAIKASLKGMLSHLITPNFDNYYKREKMEFFRRDGGLYER